MINLVKATQHTILALSVLCCASSCMVTPGDGEDIGLIQDAVEFTGFCLNGGQEVLLQAKHPNLGWQTFADAETSYGSIFFDGNRYYPWSVKSVIPYACWILEQKNNLDHEMSVQVRVLDAKSRTPLYCFEEGFTNWFPQYDRLGEMYEDRGAGVSITLFGLEIL